MAQPSVANYFHTRKRNAVEDIKTSNVKKILLNKLSDSEIKGLKGLIQSKNDIFIENDKDELKSNKTPLHSNNLNDKIVTLKNADPKVKVPTATKKVSRPRTRKIKEIPNQGDIAVLLNNMVKKDVAPTVTIIPEIEHKVIDPTELLKTPPSTPTKASKVNAMDKIKLTGKELSYNEIKHKMCRSSRLADLKASMARLNESKAKLDKIEERKAKIMDSPSLKAFKSIELEVTLSPSKHQSPEKPYLSPRKDIPARRNLLNSLTPSKASKQLFAGKKPALTLPFKYRTLAEIFRSIDTVCQIMHNRKETITFRRLKPAVEEMLKKNINEKNLGQIKSIYPDAFTFKQEKLRLFGTGTKTVQWELIVEPKITDGAMTSDTLLERRRIFFNLLIEKVKSYHHEFLIGLDPPMIIPNDKITRWHPEFDIERIPDIKNGQIPQPPNEEKMTSGKEVLEKARAMFNCNTRMEQALERLKKVQESNPDIMPEKPKAPTSVMKGIPLALLEKVRQKQAAKALETMTRSEGKDKEIELYKKLPEIAHLTRNLFVAERKSVLPIDVVMEKICDSFRTFMTKTDLEIHLRTLFKEFPTWLIFLTIRNTIYIKINKDIDLNQVLSKLDKLIKLKTSI